jgi:hypothetical protein
MQLRNESIRTQGILSLAAIVLMVGYAAHMMEVGPRQQADTQALAGLAAQGSGTAVVEPAGWVVYTGVILRDSSGFLLRDGSGIVYHFDDPSKAEPFAGKSVRVLGRLDDPTRIAPLIHVGKIEEMPA